jgi:hypothetical protein
VIDQGLADEWPPEAVAAAQEFQQGDLIRRPPIVYGASLKYPIWALTRQEAEADPGDAHVNLGLDSRDLPEFGILLSQTCDIAEDRPQPTQPWIEVSPVYEREPTAQLPEYLYVLDAMEAAVGNVWVADLRLVVALEKGLLVGQGPIDPFGGSEEKRISFGIALGERRARAALSERTHLFIDETLAHHKRKTGKRVAERVYRLLLRITEGVRLDPKAVQLHIVCQDTERITQEETEEWFQGWWDKAQLVAEAQGVNLLPPVFHRCDSMDVALYDRLVPIRFPA